MTLDDLVAFGKYRGEATWRQVADRDPAYAMWLVKTADITPEDVREALAEYLRYNYDPDPHRDDTFDDMGRGWSSDEY